MALHKHAGDGCPPLHQRSGDGEHDRLLTSFLAGLSFHTDDQAERFLSEKEPELFEFRRRLYEREVAVRYRPGTALIYRHDLWVSAAAN